MRCQQCNEAEATVHLKEVAEGKLKELHLCEACANEKGFHLVVEHNKLTIATQFIWMAENLYPETSSKVGAVQCPSCGLRYSQFSRVGRVGCAACYDAFQPQLQKILLRVHGATRHKGRVPAGAAAALPSTSPIGTAETAETSGPAGPVASVGSGASPEGPPTAASDKTGRPVVPAAAGEEKRAQLADLEEQLRRAVSAEDYEDAARLRDEIRRLQGGQR